jgi:predicted small metal-binding protein
LLRRISRFRREDVVDKVLLCECGFEARASDEEELVEAVRRHARDEHGMALTQDEALTLVRDRGANDEEEER